MCRRLKQTGISPIFFFDEPALYALTIHEPRHVVGLQELKLMLQTIKKEGVRVGLHCCSNTNWQNILPLGFDILSIDTRLSLSQVLQTGPLVTDFNRQGGVFAFGIVPTAGENPIGRETPASIAEVFWNTLRAHCPSGGDETARQLVTRGLFTPACGLALRTTSEAEAILALLRESVAVIKAGREA
jgi:hypothetical protein